jgi:DNA-binding CsgD family transcriptional regulator
MLGIIGAKLADTRTVEGVLRVVNDLGPRAIAASGQCAYLLDPDLEPTMTVASGLPERFLDEYERFGRRDDVLMRHLVQRRTAVTEADAGPAPTVCTRWGMGRILIVPLFGHGGLAGSLNFVRPTGAPPFTTHDQLTALGLAAQVSVAIARCEDTEPPSVQLKRLTGRELELLRFLARGLSNREIAVRRGVSEHAVHQALKRLYHKLEVHSRAAAVAALFSHPSGSRSPGAGALTGHELS